MTNLNNDPAYRAQRERARAAKQAAKQQAAAKRAKRVSRNATAKKAGPAPGRRAKKKGAK
jgi:hypothetical protein